MRLPEAGLLRRVAGRVARVARRVVHGRAQREADRRAAEVGIDVERRVSGGAHDAFTHAYVSARLTVLLGPTVAERLGRLNELLGSIAAGKLLEAEMDRRNNAVGRDVGRRLSRDVVPSGRAIAEEIRAALDAGRLTLIETDDRGTGRLVASGSSSGRRDGHPDADRTRRKTPTA